MLSLQAWIAAADARLAAPRKEPAPINQTFGALLRQARDRAGMSLDELASATGCSPSFLSRLENGQRLPKERFRVELLALILNLDAAATERLCYAAGFLPAAWAAVLAEVAV